jgi:putative phosphoribosyl transferase
MHEAADEVIVNAGGVALDGVLHLPPHAAGLVAFAHGSGSSRHSPRNCRVATRLHQAGFGTLLFDLLTEEEEADRRNVFDVGLLASRLEDARLLIASDPRSRGLPIGYFGASTGAAAAIIAAAGHPDVQAVVCRGGRPDLAGTALEGDLPPTLLIVGERDEEVLTLNRHATLRMRGRVRLEIVPGATHLFEEPGTLERAADLAAAWFHEHLHAERRS